MDVEDLEPRKQPAPKRNLEPLSLGELNEYISELEAEIQRVRETIAAKQKGRQGAESLFRKS